MKSKFIALMLIAGGAAFAQTRFSIHIGGHGPGCYAPPPVYYAPVRPYVDRSYGPGWGGAGYWGWPSPQSVRETGWTGRKKGKRW
jgi:hypothetical protein